MAASHQPGQQNANIIEMPNAAGICAATLCVDGQTVDAVRQAVVRGKGLFAGGLNEYARFESDPRILEALQHSEVPVWVVGFDRDRAAAVVACQAIQKATHGHCNFVAVSDTSDGSLILEAMRAGCSEYLTRPVGVDQFADAMQRLRIRLDSRKRVVAKPAGRIIGILGARGGAGATTLAVHLGCFLARKHGRRTLLLDAHRSLGHVSLYFGEDKANYHFYELVRNIGRLDDSLLEGFVIHTSSSLDILSSPDVLDDAADVSLEDIQRAIRFLGQHYEFVVIDCPHGVHPLSLAMADCCDELYLVATPDVPALRDLSRCLETFSQSSVPPETIKVVINRYSSHGALGLTQIERAIQKPIALTIPNASSDLIQAMNTGSPVLPDRKSEFAIQMKKWAAALVPDAEQEPLEPKRRFAFWN